MVVSGGMGWWKDFICVACFNIIGQRDEVETTSYQDNSFYICNVINFLTYSTMSRTSGESCEFYCPFIILY